MCRNHSEFVEGCFACKLKTLQFGMVPGAARQAASTTYWDKEVIKHDFGDTFHRDNVMEHRERVRKAIEDEG